MIELLVFLLFVFGCGLFFYIAFTDIEWLCYKSKLFSCPCCKKKKAVEEKKED